VKRQGYSLLELLIVLALTAALMLGLVQLMMAGTAASLRQDKQAQLQERARLAISLVRKAARPAGFTPTPWDATMVLDDPLDGSQDSVSTSSDRLVVTQWSDLNCFDYRNPDSDTSGTARFYLRETQLDLNSTRHLALQCRYGPTKDSMVTQIRRQGRVPGISGFQIEYGEDLDANGQVEYWSPAGSWSDSNAVRGLKISLTVTEQELTESLEFQLAFPGRSG
jgi:prepilin-type N-terminal cleavage/methylation domain-containing protein